MSPEPPSTLRYYLAICKRHSLVIALAVLVPLCVGVALYVSTPKTYRGTAEVVINRQSLADQLNGTPDPVAAASDFIDIVQTDADAAQSIAVARRVVTSMPRLGLTPQRFLDRSNVSASPNADVLTFTADSRDPATAIRLANVYANAYTSYSAAQSTAAIAAAQARLQRRITAADATGNSALAAHLRAQAEDLQALAAVQTANAFVVRPSTTAAVTSPRKSVDIGLFLILGLALAAVLVAILEGLDTKVRTPEEAEGILGARFLGAMTPPPKGFEHDVLALARPRDPATEGFRTLHANLDVNLTGQGAKVFMVTSSLESEGKSLTVANLAAVAARAGRSVVVVDLDLRRPGQNALFGSADGGPGLTDVLRGDASVDEALLPIRLSGDHGSETGAGGLSVLRSGPVPADPGAIAASEGLALLVESLRDDFGFDLVLIDAPPMLRTGDARAISRVCDAIMLVVRIPTVTRPMLRDLAKAASTASAPVAGFVVTGRSAATESPYGSYDQAVPEVPIAAVRAKAPV
jgi:capsular exopolysaccharide synthesis family protein